MKPSKNLFKPERFSVLILGIYLSKHKNYIEHLVNQFNSPGQWNVKQKWIGLGRKYSSHEVLKVTVMSIQDSVPKFVLLNKILSEEDLTQYDFVIICDDDIVLPEGFLEKYLELVVKYDLALAQPARTHNSYIDWHFVEQLSGLKARRTRYVEIGPLFSVRKDIYSVIFPFDESVYMGWGYDFVWPCIIEKLSLRMGIIDATPVDHSLRKPVENYQYQRANKSMTDYLSQNPHLSKVEAFRVLESYA
jgi:hypothetical protein